MQRTAAPVVAALLSLSVSGCSYYFAEDEDLPPADDGGGDVSDGSGGDGEADAGPDPGPDASPVCDPSAILPQGWQPVAQVSTAAVTNQPDPDRPGAFVTTVDATAGGSASQATQPFVYLDLDAEEGAAAVAIDDVASFGSSDWDIGLKRFVVRSNSGDSGPADEEVATVSGEELRDGDSVPSDLFADDDWSDAGCALVRDERGGPRTRFSNWYQVVGGRFEPRPVLHVVRLGAGRYAEIDVSTYYGDPASPERGGVYVLHWRRFP